MRVVVWHQELAGDARRDEVDVLTQARAVTAALATLGHEVVTLMLPSDLDAGAAALVAAAPDVVFNLVESIDGEGRSVHRAPELLDRLGVPYTGSDGEATLMSSSKLATKRTLRAVGLPTPAFYVPAAATGDAVASGSSFAPGRYVVKSVWEHGSLGLEADSVVAVRDAHALAREVRARAPDLGGEAFAEAYVHGREFNLALLQDGVDPVCLPPAEIRFAAHAADQPRIVGYRAKWDAGSREDRQTPRSFVFGVEDAALLARLQEMVVAVWRAFGLSGYARVDLRVDEAGQPFVIDVNTNPCLSPDAGYAAALARAGLSTADAVCRILAAAIAPRSRSRAP